MRHLASRRGRSLLLVAFATACAATAAHAEARAAPAGAGLIAFTSWWPGSAGDVATLGGHTSVICGVDGRGRSYRLTAPSAGDEEMEPSWSADGLELAVVNGPVTGPDVPNFAYWQLGDLRRIVAIGPDAAEWPSWAPAAQTIAYQHPADEAVTPTTPAAIWVDDRSGGTPRQVSAGRGRATWAPDATRIAVAGEGITIIDLDSSVSTTLLAGTYVPWVDWSPDGASLLFQAGVVDAGVVRVIGTDGSNAHVLAPRTAGYTPIWSPDGHSVAVQTGDSIRVTALGGRTRQLYTGLLVADAGIAWQAVAHPDRVRDLPPCVIVGSPTRRRLVGSRFADVIVALSASDSISAGAGNDIVNTRNGRRDVVACGKGRDTVYADRLDRIARDCETVSR